MSDMDPDHVMSVHAHICRHTKGLQYVVAYNMHVYHSV